MALLDLRRGRLDPGPVGDVQDERVRVCALLRSAVAASSPRRGSLAPTSTVMPSAASCSAAARPMPLFAPVTSAIFC